MKNEEVIEEFIRMGIKAKTKNVFIDKDVLYSYGYHFPIAIRLLGGFVVNSDKYSSSTSRHQNCFMRSMNGDNCIFMNTEKLKQIIQSDVKTIEEAKNLFILRAL